PYPPSYHITEVHRILKRVSGIKVPFKELRQACNKMGVEIARRLSSRFPGRPSQKEFTRLVKWAIAGNVLDFRTVGTGYGLGVERIQPLLEEKVKEGLKVDDTPKLYQNLKKGGKKILYVLDNVGEIALDKLLMEKINLLGNEVITCLRGGPITSDATFEDGEEVNLFRSPVKVILAGPDTLGISWREKSAILSRTIKEVDIIITKGQANYYVFSQYRAEIPGRVFCLFTTKCDSVSEKFGFKGKINLAVEVR
ncbi:MAG TPA: DUF89 family protein, partial [bacterium]|nr:DUF89 family protein [bacterium]HEX67941.1 DUF89 family protein [bacterium]